MHREIETGEMGDETTLGRTHIEQEFIAKHKDTKLTFQDPFQESILDPVSRKLRE